MGAYLALLLIIACGHFSDLSLFPYTSQAKVPAEVAEQADVLDSKSGGGNPVWVRSPNCEPQAPVQQNPAKSKKPALLIAFRPLERFVQSDKIP